MPQTATSFSLIGRISNGATLNWQTILIMKTGHQVQVEVAHAG